MAAVQIAKAIGANVIAAAGSPLKLEISKTLGGADFAVDYTKPDWQKEVLKITGGKGVDVIYDPVGLIKGMKHLFCRCYSFLKYPYFVDSLKCIAWKGRAIVVGFAGGKIEQVSRGNQPFRVLRLTHSACRT